MMMRIGSILSVLAAYASLSSALAPSSSRSVVANSNQCASDSSGMVTTRRSFVGAAAAAGLAGLVAPSVAFAAEGAGLPAKGAKAPDFELPNSRGNGLVSLDALVKNSKWTVLYFYPGAFTSGCTLEARGFQKDLEEYRKLNAQVVGVSVDPVEKNAQFCSEEKLDFFMLSDKGGLVSKKYGSALSIPGFGTFSNRQTYIIDPNGELRWIFTDVESKIARHSSEVLEKLTELEKA
eukprot:CAMPEP_0172362096 /NCGR_PEP_ID=MMETSP1060-20121228/5788_1 /TAXON_ID=37318 /ORGANISM="Pseudo-nitzschia pungens, Strain cf. cingulata" /LENGTH=234 /DNA_ID=CAMNT_0013084521 /DNA_START=313 /DNA_END=1017 /DNA_ORIENTATION=+